MTVQTCQDDSKSDLIKSTEDHTKVVTMDNGCQDKNLL